jgi:conjugative transfer signal peptidase TraF
MTARPKRPADAPLFAWGDALRDAKQRRARLRRRIAIVSVGIIMLLASIALPPSPRLLWNATPSAPIGLYRVDPGAWIVPGDMVIARVPARYRRLADERRYVPLGVPLVKRVAAGAGDEVCALGPEIFVNGEPVVARRAADGHGRPMPMWSGCTRIHGRQLFLLTDDPASFDGRYFGVSEAGDIVGQATLLWHP